MRKCKVNDSILLCNIELPPSHLMQPCTKPHHRPSAIPYSEPDTPTQVKSRAIQDNKQKQAEYQQDRVSNRAEKKHKRSQGRFFPLPPNVPRTVLAGPSVQQLGYLNDTKALQKRNEDVNGVKDAFVELLSRCS